MISNSFANDRFYHRCVAGDCALYFPGCDGHWFLKATGAEPVIAKAFQGNEVKMIVFASIVGGLAPSCSCDVIPFIAGLLAAGPPLSVVMALGLSSRLMDPSSFFITVGELGLIFAVAKTIIAILIGLAGGFLVHSCHDSGICVSQQAGVFNLSVYRDNWGHCFRYFVQYVPWVVHLTVQAAFLKKITHVFAVALISRL